MKNLNFILVDDNQLYRESVKFLLTKKLHHQVIAEASTGEEFLNLPMNLLPDIIFMDLAMPGIDGYEATKQFFWRYPNSKIIAITNFQEKAYLQKLIEVGFKGCIFKNNLFNEITDAINNVMNNKLWFKNSVLLNNK